MNQQTPLRTPQRPVPRWEEKPTKQEHKNPLAKLLLILFSTAVVLIIASVITVAVLLSKLNGTPSDGENPKDKPSAEQNGSSDRGAVPTDPSRSDYSIGNAQGYQTIEGISTKHAILLDLNSYTAIAGKNADTEICPASMTKVMTILVVCERLDSLDDQLSLTADVINESLEGEYSGMKALWTEGNSFSVEDLLYLAFLQSDTVACKTLANYIAGSEKNFVDLMNKKALDIGMKNTVFCNSTGLDLAGQTYHSTCRDMAMLMAYALENPLANRVLTAGNWTLKKAYASLNDRVSIKPTWITRRLGEATLETVTVKGGKTGYETAPGYCLVSYATSNSGNGKYILVTVGGNGLSEADSAKEVKKIYNTYAD